jgi:hypothetical protein
MKDKSNWALRSAAVDSKREKEKSGRKSRGRRSRTGRRSDIHCLSRTSGNTRRISPNQSMHFIVQRQFFLSSAIPSHRAQDVILRCEDYEFSTLRRVCLQGISGYLSDAQYRSTFRECRSVGALVPLTKCLLVHQNGSSYAVGTSSPDSERPADCEEAASM